MNKLGTNCQVKLILQTKYPFVRLCILRRSAPTSCASNIYLKTRNILKFYCAHEHPEFPYCTQAVYYFFIEILL